eukprot:7279154-Prymnesium_polylepis.2
MGMGPAIIAVRAVNASGEPLILGLLLDKAYLARSGESSVAIISSGRLWKTQGIALIDMDIDELRIAVTPAEALPHPGAAAQLHALAAGDRC